MTRVRYTSEGMAARNRSVRLYKARLVDAIREEVLSNGQKYADRHAIDKAVERLVINQPKPQDLEHYAVAHMAWSLRTFGPGTRTGGLIKHIQKELAEIMEAPGDVIEWIDVIILAIDGYWRAGGTAAGLVRDLWQKQAANRARKWPPQSSQDEPTEHLR